jgi:hypothetical protein
VKNLKVKGSAPEKGQNANETYYNHRYGPNPSPTTTKAPPYTEPPNIIYEFGKYIFWRF